MSSAWWISGRERPADVRLIGFVQTLTARNDSIASFKNATILHRFTSRALWQTLSSDIFAGQIIASLIVLIFVAVFLLREWISQNARPGVFEEDEIAGIPQDPPVPNLQPVIQPIQDVNVRLLAPPRPGPLDVDVEARRARLWRHRPIPPNPRFEAPERLEILREPIRRPQDFRVEPLIAPPLLALPPLENLDTPPVSTGKGKEREDVTADPEPAAPDIRRRMPHRIDDGDGDDSSGAVAQAGSSFSTSTFTPSSSPSELGLGSSTAIESTPFEFTFRLPADRTEEDIREPVPEMPARSLVALQRAMMTGSPIPDEEPRRRSIVFVPDTSPRLSPSPATPVVDEMALKSSSPPASSPTSSELSFAHLPLSNSSLTAEGSLDSSGFHHLTASEHLGAENVYRPEVLATDSSNTSPRNMNMDRKKRTREEMEEFEHYFRDPQPATPGPVDADVDRTDVPLEGAHRLEHDHIAEGEERPPHGEAPEDEDDSEDEDAPELIFWDADADREDEEDEDEDAVDIGDFNVPNRPGAQAQAPPQPQPPAPAEQLNDAVDDLEAGVEDDMEGALEGRFTVQEYPH